jgi:hypothetical protein
MITGQGPRPCPHGVPRFSHEDFFADGEGWDILVLQDRADIIKEWTQLDAKSTRMNKSLEALDTFASWVRTAAANMRRRPSVLLFHRCLWGYRELAQISDTADMCRKARAGIDLYLGKLSSGLGSSFPVHIMPACDAFCLVHGEDADVFRKLYAGDQEHPSRMGTYLNALLLYGLVTGLSPSQAPKFKVTDDTSRLNADMWNSPEDWPSSDLWQRHAWPRCSLPEVDDELDGRLRMWAHNVLPHPGRPSPASKMLHCHEISKQMHLTPRLQRNIDGPCAPLPNSKSIGSARTEKQPPATSYTTQPRLHFYAAKVDGRISHQELLFFPKTLHVGPTLLTSARGKMS